MQDKPTIILHFKDDERESHVVAHHVVAMQRFSETATANGKIIPRRTRVDFYVGKDEMAFERRVVETFIINDTDEDFARNLEIWQSALA